MSVIIIYFVHKVQSIPLLCFMVMLTVRGWSRNKDLFVVFYDIKMSFCAAGLGPAGCQKCITMKTRQHKQKQELRAGPDNRIGR